MSKITNDRSRSHQIDRRHALKVFAAATLMAALVVGTVFAGDKDHADFEITEGNYRASVWRDGDYVYMKVEVKKAEGWRNIANAETKARKTAEKGGFSIKDANLNGEVYHCIDVAKGDQVDVGVTGKIKIQSGTLK